MRITYTRVRDTRTGHEFDVPATDPRLREGLLVPVNKPHYPDSPLPRPMKPRLRMRDL